jgi:hypothetical protein
MGGSVRWKLELTFLIFSIVLHSLIKPSDETGRFPSRVISGGRYLFSRMQWLASS